jgi:hypothetical protein
MSLVLLHGVFGAILFGATFADVFFLRSAASRVFEPKNAMATWRRHTAMIQMVSFLVVVGLGLAQWMPNMRSYPPAIFHGKLTLALAFLVLGKVRLFRERKTGEPATLLTRLMFACVFIVFTLGLSVRLGGI